MSHSLSHVQNYDRNPVDTVARNLNQPRPMLNNYTRYARIGNGHHGEVFLCFRIDARFPVNDVRRWFPVAMKSVRRDTVIDKYSRLKANRIALTAPRPSKPAVVDKLNTTELKIKKEIAIMKKLSHPNVVRLFEVIDDRMKEKVYLVLEYLGGGEIKWRTDHDEPTLTLAQTRRIMRDAILGLEYLHYQGIIHRDIKPANLLWTEDRHHVKIADFGVSHFSYHQRLAEAGQEGIDRDDLDDILMDESDLTKRAGTPAFLAPELIFEHFEEKNRHFVVSSLVPKFSNKSVSKPTITKAIDVWALGVTLYCLLFGKTPFLSVTEGGTTEFALYRAICNKDWEVASFMCRDQVATGGRHPKKGGKHKQPEGAKVIGLLERLLQKDQTKRITLDEVKSYHWITADLLNPPEWAKLTSPDRNKKVEVTKSDMFLAVSSVHFRWGLRRGMSALFKPLKVRSRMTPTADYSPMGINSKSDLQLGRLLPNVGSNKSPAISGVQDVHVYVQPRALGGTVDKGKGKAVVRNSSQPSSLAGLSATSSSPALDAIRRQRSQMGILGHEQQQLQQSSDSPSGSTPVDPAPRLEDIMSIATWRPTKYPTPTTSLTPLLANIYADGTSTFRSLRSPRSRKPDPNINVVAPVPRVLPRTVSTLEGGFRPAEDMLGIYGPEGGLISDAPVAALTNFKRASSWGQGDEVAMAISSADIASVTSVNAEVNDTVRLVGAGGIERLGNPVGPTTSASAGDSIGPGHAKSNHRRGSAGEGTAGGGRTVCAKSSVSVSEGSCSSGVMRQWEPLDEGITKWRDQRRKHQHRDASSSTLPWVDSMDDVAFGDSGVDGDAQTSDKGKLRDQKHSQTESRGELTMEWMDINYRTPGGYYGASMGPGTQFWRHGRGTLSGSSTMTKSVTSSRDNVLDHNDTSAARYQKEVKVVSRREGPLDKFLSGGDSDSDTDEELSDEDGESTCESRESKGFGNDSQEQHEEHCDEDHANETDDEDDGEHVQQITMKTKNISLRQ